MMIKSVWTSNEFANVRYVLRKKYGNLSDGTLVKYAAREIAEQYRIKKMQNKIQPRGINMFDSFIKKLIVRRVFEHLSPFQSFLCILYAIGYDFPEIAAEFHVSLRTVQRWFKEIHSDVSRILEK